MMYIVLVTILQQGPVEADRLVAFGVRPETLVWKQGMPQWAPASQVPELADLFYAQPPQVEEVRPASDEPKPAAPETYLIWAILATICCCMPFGVISIVYASRVNSLYNSGYYDEALVSSRRARNWALASFVCGLVSTIFYTVFVLSSGYIGAGGDYVGL